MMKEKKTECYIHLQRKITLCFKKKNCKPQMLFNESLGCKKTTKEIKAKTLEEILASDTQL